MHQNQKETKNAALTRRFETMMHEEEQDATYQIPCEHTSWQG